MAQSVCSTRPVLAGLVSLLAAVVATLCFTTTAVAADYKTLANARTKAVPAKGEAGVVVQIEAPGKSKKGKTSPWHYAPDPKHANFSDVQIISDPRARISTHSTSVARLFFGNSRSVASGISKAYVFSANNWVSQLLRWNLGSEEADALFPGSVVNHSWVGGQSSTVNARLLRRLDYSAVLKNTVNVYGVRKKGSGEPLFSSAFNGISVGGAQMNIATAYDAVDTIYAGERYRPEIVAPNAYASSAAAMVSASAVRLNALAASLNTPPLVEHRSGSGLLPVELIKALLMASAKKSFVYTHKDEALDYKFGSDGLSPNGMDVRYGAGMLDVGAAEALLKSRVDTRKGQNSSRGWYYHTGGSNEEVVTPTINLDANTDLSVSLVWLANLKPASNQTLEASVHDLDLCIVDKDSGNIIAESNSRGDSSEHLTVSVPNKNVLQLVVRNKTEATVEGKPDTAVDRPYALAWHAAGPLTRAD